MSSPAIDIADLSKFYGKTRGIEHLDLKIGEGEIFGFIGPNGAGKSTTIRILLNLIFPSGGSASVFGMDVVRETRKIKMITGYVPSDANAYADMTVRKFLEYFSRFHNLSSSERRIKYLTEYLGLDTSRRISDLSMGNKKKLAIAQSLIHSPRLLILDEPTSGLDPLMQARFFELLREENQGGMTIFLSSHILSEVQSLCKRVAIIRDGKVIRVEDIETLRSRQLKKVSVEFADKLNIESTFPSGIQDLESGNGNSFTFMYSGDITTLLRHLAEKEIINLLIEEPSLEEIFMHYYK